MCKIITLITALKSIIKNAVNVKAIGLPINFLSVSTAVYFLLISGNRAGEGMGKDSRNLSWLFEKVQM